MSRQPAAQPLFSIEGLRTKLAALEDEQSAAFASEQIAQEAWKAALADLQLGEGQKTGVSRTRSGLDRARENLLGLDGAIAEIRRRISATEDAEREATLAALVQRADSAATALEGCVSDLLQFDRKATRILEAMAQHIAELTAIKGQHQDLAPDGIGPGEISGLSSTLWNGLAADNTASGRTAILLAHARLAEFDASWRHGGQAQHILGAKPQAKKEN